VVVNYRPLSARHGTGTSFDTLHEGLCPWMVEPARTWLRPFVERTGRGREIDYQMDWMRDLQSRMHLDPPLAWSDGYEHRVAAAFLGRLNTQFGELSLDILDYALHFMAGRYPTEADRRAKATELDRVLTMGGSAWEVTLVGSDAAYALTRRALGPIVEAIEEVRPVAERAGHHLTEAWRHLAGRDPLPDQAYFQALLAVEAAAKPVVAPNDGDATLGKMIGVVRDAPQKFVFVLGDADVIVLVMKAMWSTHRRHGTDDRSAPMGMSQDEADAAVHLALTLVRWFAGGGFTRV
jgi:hypothetical protein